MKCETCTEYMTTYEYECHNGICDKCHENFVKEDVKLNKLFDGGENASED